MFIDNAEPQFIYVTEKDAELHFCCEECMKRYVETFNPVKIGDKIVTVENIIEDISIVQEGEEISIFYSKSVEETTYIPTYCTRSHSRDEKELLGFEKVI
jgi:hypothetical protein